MRGQSLRRRWESHLLILSNRPFSCLHLIVNTLISEGVASRLAVLVATRDATTRFERRCLVPCNDRDSLAASIDRSRQIFLSPIFMRRFVNYFLCKLIKKKERKRERRSRFSRCLDRSIISSTFMR